MEGTLNAKARMYYMNRHFDASDRTQESMAIGGWLDYETPYWYGIGAGGAVYISQGAFFIDSDRDGAQFLRPHQKGFAVLGQSYLQAEALKTRVRIFRQIIDTPFLNPYDVKMAPVTFEAYTVESWYIKYLKLMFSHVTKIKRWNDSKFNNISVVAGFPGTDEPVTLGGIVFTPGDFLTLQVWDYYCHNFMNVVYAQLDARWKISDEFLLSGSCQGMYQNDVGRSINGDFNTGMLGFQSAIGGYGATITMGFTITDYSNDIVNPWGSYPGYTSIMEEDSDLAGEKAWVIGIAYDFSKIGIKGLSAFMNHTESFAPHNGTLFSPVQKELDFTVDYHFEGFLKNLSVRLRAAFVDGSLSTQGEDYSDYRVIVNYDF